MVATTTDNGANYVASFKHFGLEDLGQNVPIEGEDSVEKECDPEVVISQPANVHDQLQELEEEDTELPKPFHFRYVSSLLIQINK